MRLVHYICVADGDGAIGCGEVSRIKGCPSVISVETWDVATISAVVYICLPVDDFVAGKPMFVLADLC